MAYKQTVAIIGAVSPLGTVIAKRIAAQYRLLLMDAAQSPLIDLQNTVLTAHPNAEVDVLHCCKDASWEADIIIVAIPEPELEGVAVRIREVTTCKPVIHVMTTTGADSRLTQLLPHANVVTVILKQLVTEENHDLTGVIQGKNEAAIRTTSALLAAIGCTPQYA